jgi:hypothetical protein
MLKTVADMCACTHSLLLPPSVLPLMQNVAPDVEYLLARAQTLQLQSGSAYLTAEHLASALDVPMGGQGGGKDGALSKAELEDTMRQMLGPVSST